MDLVIPSLDAGRETAFEGINRPHPSLDFERYVQGLVRLKDHFRGEIWLEVFIVEGLNDTSQEIEALKDRINRIAPHRVHINSVDRSPAEEWVRAPSRERLQQIARALKGDIIVSSPGCVLSSLHP